MLTQDRHAVRLGWSSQASRSVGDDVCMFPSLQGQDKSVLEKIWKSHEKL